MAKRTEYAVRWTDAHGRRHTSDPLPRKGAEEFRDTFPAESKAHLVFRTISPWEFVPVTETKYVNGVRVTTTQHEEGRTVDASCQCFGSDFRVHSTTTCPNLRKQKEKKAVQAAEADLCLRCREAPRSFGYYCSEWCSELDDAENPSWP